MDQSSHQQLACRSYKGHSRGVDTWPWLKAPVSSSSRPRTSTEDFHVYKPSHHLKSHPTGQTVMSKSPPENNPYNVLHHRQRACKHQLASTISTEILVQKAILLRCVKFKQPSTISELKIWQPRDKLKSSMRLACAAAIRAPASAFFSAPPCFFFIPAP